MQQRPQLEMNLQHCGHVTCAETYSAAKVLLIEHFHVFTGKVCLTFFGQWSEVQSEVCSKAMDQMYCAPGK